MADRYDEHLLLGYLENDLTPRQQAEFEQQLKADAGLRNLIAQLQQDRQMLRQLPKAKAPPHLLEQATMPLERQMLLDATSPTTPEPGPHRFNIVKLMSYSSLAAIVVVGLTLTVITMTRPQPVWPPASDNADLVMETGPRHETAPKKTTDRKTPQRVTEPNLTTNATRRIGSLAGSKPGTDEVAYSRSEELALVTGQTKTVRTERDRLADVEPIELKPFAMAEPPQPRNGASFTLESVPVSPEVESTEPPVSAPLMPLSLTASPVEQDSPPTHEGHLVLNKVLATNIPEVKNAESSELQPNVPDAEQPANFLADADAAEPVLPETIDMQLNVTTNDLLACETSLRAYDQRLASRINISLSAAETSKAVPRVADNTETSLLDQVATMLRQAGVVAPREAEPRKLVLQMPVEQLPNLLDELNAPKHQSAELTNTASTWGYNRFRTRHHPEPTTTAVAKALGPTERNRDGTERWLSPNWAALIDQQLPLSPVVPVFEPGTKLNLHVVIYQMSQAVEADAKIPHRNETVEEP